MTVRVIGEELPSSPQASHSSPNYDLVTLEMRSSWLARWARQWAQLYLR